jgi:nucleoside-diphosphate-sugar epimerase
MRVFVTGGTGLVGSHTIERLRRRGHDVVAMVRDGRGARVVEALGATAARGRVEEAGGWAPAGEADAIVHAAALVTAPARWPTYQQTNVEGTRNAVRAARDANVRIVHISSVAIYGRQPVAPAGIPVTEDGPFAEIAESDFYARAKREAEDALWEMARARGLNAVALRPCVIYGERDRQFIPRLLRGLRFGFAPIIGPGTNRLATVYVGNVVDAIESAIDHPDVSGPFNVANDGGLTQLELYDVVEEALGRRLRRIHVSERAALRLIRAAARTHAFLRPGRYGVAQVTSGGFLARENPFTSDRARRTLGWRPSTPSREALLRTVRWFMR